MEGSQRLEAHQRGLSGCEAVAAGEARLAEFLCGRIDPVATTSLGIRDIRREADGAAWERIMGRLLHRFETGGWLQGRRRLPSTPAAVRLELGVVCDVWIETAVESGDPRYLNSALKLRELITNDATAGVQDTGVMKRLFEWVRPGPPQARRRPYGEPHCAPVTASQIVVLAGEHSVGGVGLLNALLYSDVRPRAVIAMQERDDHGSGPWYPGKTIQHGHLASIVTAAIEAGIPVYVFRPSDWLGVRKHLTELEPQLIVLAGMGMVPDAIWQIPRLGVLNAHNGRLPTYRGMDAVAWACLRGDPVFCTTHLAVGGVDTGPVLHEALVQPPERHQELRHIVKRAQLDLLVLGIQAALRGQWALHAYDDPGIQYYRMHHRLRAALDTRFR